MSIEALVLGKLHQRDASAQAVARPPATGGAPAGDDIGHDDAWLAGGES